MKDTNLKIAQSIAHSLALGVTQFGQMTAGSFMYIGPQGIVHGTTITVLNATPQGLACLTMTHAGSLNSLTHSQAASASTILLYDSSLP